VIGMAALYHATSLVFATEPKEEINVRSQMGLLAIELE